MPSLQTVLLFMAAALALNVTPGPSILYVMSRTLAQGTTAGLVSALGLGVGSLCHACAAALGLSVLIAYSPVAYTIVKSAGALYLVILGIRMIRARDVTPPEPHLAGASLRRVFWQGVLTDLLNPKIVLFFVSFLPQFVDPNRGSVAAQTLVLGLLFQVTGIPTNMAVAVLGGTISRWFSRRPAFARLRNAIAGTVLIGLGVRLALSERR